MTTRKKSRPNRQLGILKLAVAAGSLAASLLGTRLLAKQEDVVVQSNDTAVSTEPIVINVPIVLPSNKIREQNVVNGSSSGLNSTSAPVRQELSLDLPAIPQAVSPQIQAMPPV
ncbi:hypothetical protein MNBD_CHLOROFLEXI01-828, partial [hydrothermal vent metagenome]